MRTTFFKIGLAATLIGATAASLTLAASAPASTSVTVLDDELAIQLGARGGRQTWRGSLGDVVRVSFVERGRERVIEGTLAKHRRISSSTSMITIDGRIDGGDPVSKSIIVNDIVTLTLVSKGDGQSADDATTGTSRTTAPADGSASAATPATSHRWGFPTDPGVDDPNLPKVFLLPLEGGVGDGTRHDEIKAIGEVADRFGPGQIIVFKVKSPGGLVLEADLIHETMMDLKSRHRLIAWIEEAISAAAFTSLHCNEIYFMTKGALGSATMFAGQKAIEGEQLAAWVKKFGDVAAESGHSRELAEAMITNSELASYDPADGDTPPRIYGDLSGEIILSRETENLTINATDAVACGFASGVADTEEDLAELLQLPRWYETTDDGRLIHQRWHETLKRAQREVPELLLRVQGALGADPGNNEITLSRQIDACNKVLNWMRRIGPHTSMMMGLPPDPEQIEQLREQLRERLRQIRNAR